MINIDLNNHSINLTCPKCLHKFFEAIGKLEINPTVVCTECGSDINIQTDELKKAIDNIESDITSIRDAIKNLNRR